MVEFRIDEESGTVLRGSIFPLCEFIHLFCSLDTLNDRKSTPKLSKNYTNLINCDYD
jgi:hypothetical protein